MTMQKYSFGLSLSRKRARHSGERKGTSLPSDEKNWISLM